MFQFLIMNNVILDDIGSYPLPAGVSKEWIQKAFSNYYDRGKLFPLINAAFHRDDAGV
jgi:5-methyltetrahydropteroyltriglutamate--homocysteine methyltransferase